MLRLAVFALFLAAASASSVTGVVEGIVPCGSKGEILQVRVTDCTNLPCILFQKNTYEIEVDFKPAAAHTTLQVLVSVVATSGETVIVDDVIAANVQPGNSYTLAYPWTVREDSSTGSVLLRIQLKNDDVVELCGLATAVIRRASFIK